MFQIILDTSVLYGDFRLDGSNLRLLLQLAGSGGMAVYVPQVVIDELAGKFREYGEARLGRLTDTAADLQRQTGLSVSITTIDEHGIRASVTEYRDWAKQQFVHSGVDVPD